MSDQSKLRDFQAGGRSLAYGGKAMVATSHPLASLAARDCLAAGGNAVDAAIVASAILCVVEPQSTGIAGDCFALLKVGDKPIVGFNGSGYAGSKANVDDLLAEGLREIDYTTGKAVTVPGAIDAWDRLLEDYGTMSLAEALKPAQKIAAEGFIVLPRVAFDWQRNEARLVKRAGSQKHLLVDGKAPQQGTLFKSAGLAAALQMIIEHGRDGFYKGAVAQEIIDTLDAEGGLLTLEDLADYKGEYVTPIKGTYKGHDVYEIPPNGHGVTALILLNILAKFDMAKYAAGSAERHHIHMEATRFAYALRDKYVADPKFADVPVDGLLSDEVATMIAAQINIDKKVDEHILPELPKSDTITLSVVDGNGNAISFINSVFMPFGTGIVTDKYGVSLQCRGAGFTLERGHPNQIEPRKRPMHTIIPAMLEKDGELKMAFGVMGGSYQPCGHAYFLSNVLDYGMDIQAAIDFPRMFMEGERLAVENTISEKLRADLQNKGHEVFEVDTPWGGAQVVEICKNADQTLFKGASDPRKDGIALGL
ncbi:MAG: gamma-glutamyltransferase [Alphaproteobacteria bacterium]|nr:gamma-glutamyltransferase [Alphaproteobacteria bacterium]